MAGKRVSVTIKIPETILFQMDEKIDCGVFCDRSDFIMQSIWYQIHKTELREGVRADVVKDVDALLTTRLYSPENQQFLYKISEEVAEKILHEKYLKDLI